jgi:hypothetical protein
MLSIVSSCLDTLESIRKIKEKSVSPNTLSDCYRIANRCEPFVTFLYNFQKHPDLINNADVQEKALVVDLEKTYQAVEAYMNEFSKRNTFKGTTDPTFRYSTYNDYAKINQRLMRLVVDFGILHDIDYEQLRQEDLEVRLFTLSLV